jgi:hypothetical protein
MHLLDESGALRRQLLFLCSDTCTRTRLDPPVRLGDTIAILHSVSGG